MKSISSRHYLFLYCATIANTKEIIKGVFSCEGPNNHVKHLKITMLIQQHLFWKKGKLLMACLEHSLEFCFMKHMIILIPMSC